MIMKRFAFVVGAVCMSVAMLAQPTLKIETQDAGIPVQKTMYGLFFEDINYAADGGLYAELVKNRSFEFDNPLMGWTTFGNVQVRDDGPFDRCPHYVRLSYAGHPVMFSGLENEGYFGMGIEEGKQYRFTMWARTAPISKKAKPAKKEFVTFHLCDDDTQGENQMFHDEVIEVIGSEWKKYEVVFTAPKTVTDATLRIYLETWSEDENVEYRKDCCVDLEHISLFPVDTYNNDENGLRADIAQVLADLKPGVLRFPGGCIVEGTTLEQRYQWKNSVGPVENRPVNMNRWNYTFAERQFPDYYQSYGLGFYEFFRFAEEIGAEALPVISCGMACQFQNDPNDKPHAAIKELQPYINDALDLIEFANGPATSKWGKVRADMGHPEPFNLHYLAVGNEQWGDDFIEHLRPFVEQIRAKYPDIKLIGSSGPYSGGEWFNDLWPQMRELGCDLVDEHFYSSETFFENNATRYDNYPREGTKVFAGEYACHGADGKKFNHFNAALVESAFMTGLERNADVVYMATYAPLLAHIQGWQWRPDLVWFDNTRVMRTCSYYVQQLYSVNKGDYVLPAKVDGKPLTGQQQLYASAVRQADEIIVKITNLSKYNQTLNIEFDGLQGAVTGGTLTTLYSSDLMAENTLDDSDKVIPVTANVDMTPCQNPQDYWQKGWYRNDQGNRVFKTSVAGSTFSVFKFKVR
jgi:alpha-L-arabinofuranosidase